MTNKFSYSKDGLSLTEDFEGLRLTEYPDIEGVQTIGYGHTGKEVKSGMVITQDQAEGYLRADTKAASDAVNRLVTVAITQDEFDALVDFTFNVGITALTNSTLLHDLNSGDFVRAADQFEEWDHAGGKVVAGLLRRRQAERDMFNEKD